MKLFNISDGKFSALMLKGMDFAIIYLLERAYEGIDLTSYDIPRVKALVLTLERRGYLRAGIITEEGKELYNSILEAESTIKVRRVERKEEDWKVFLSHYPPNNSFTWRGRTFEGERGIRKNTKDGEAMFTKILNNKEYTCEEMCRAVMAEAISKMENSYKTGENKMRYFQGTETWLRQKQYENWVDEGRELTETQIMAYKEAYSRKKRVKRDTGIDI